MFLANVSLCAEHHVVNRVRVRHPSRSPKVLQQRAVDANRSQTTALTALRLAQSRQPLPEAVTFSIILCIPLDDSALWRKTLLYYMLSLNKRHLQHQARAYEVVLSGDDEIMYAEARVVVKSICPTCIIHTTDHTIHVASIEAIGRHGSGGLTDEEATKHVVLYIGHMFPKHSGKGHDRSLHAAIVNGAPVFNSVAGGWATTLAAFNRDVNIQVAGCGFDKVGRPLLNQWYVRASHVRRLVHPFVYFPNSYFYHMCGAGCVNDWMVTFDKQYTLDSLLFDDAARMTICEDHVIARTV